MVEGWCGEVAWSIAEVARESVGLSLDADTNLTE
jgi:hypothetical protein